MLSKYNIILTIAAFIINEDKKILIVKKSPYEKIDAGLWTIPGGKVNPHEHIIDALKREAKEEVDLDIIDYRWIGEDVFVSDGKYFHGEHFLCSVKDNHKVLLEKNLLEYYWISKQEIDAYEFHPNIKKEILNIFENYI